VDLDGAVVLDVDLVDETQFVDVGGDFRIVDRFQRRNYVVGQARQLIGGNGGRNAGTVGLLFRRLGALLHSCVFHHRRHPKNLRAFSSASARASTSARLLYMAKDALQVEVTPKRFNSGWAQCVPARTATPCRSITIDTSCA